MGHPIVLDLETQKAFHHTEHRKPEELGVSVVGVYSYETDKFRAFREHEFDELFRLIERSSLIVGFNVARFDLPALQPYYVGSLEKFPVLDMLEDVKTAIGRRIALDEFAKETLHAKKSGHGLMAINYFKEGKWDELISYCLDDVRITKALYEYGKTHGKIYYQSPFGRREVRVNWNGMPKQGGEEVNLTLGI
ncbi:ribonuclease H-like domain-containing protein [Candidatus Roizmanbacteria bacterium]|nr:ribonuclease H-like domain-containing protein [Candidatus Roizmanbacteria bacterium]